MDSDAKNPSLVKRQIRFPNDNRAAFVKAPAETRAGDLIDALGIERPAIIFLLIGGADDLDPDLNDKIERLLDEGLALAAADANALIIDGGTKAGVMALMGRAVALRGRATPLLGVAPEGKVTYPGGPAEGTITDGAALDPNHSHFFLVEGSKWSDGTDGMFSLVSQLAKESRVVAVLVNGGEETRQEVERAAQLGWPVIAIEGSGRLANEVAQQVTFAEQGDFEVVELSAGPEKLRNLILTYGENALAEAWKRLAHYNAASIVNQRRHKRLLSLTLIIGVLGTLLAIAQSQFDGLAGPGTSNANNVSNANNSNNSNNANTQASASPSAGPGTSSSAPGPSPSVSPRTSPSAAGPASSPGSGTSNTTPGPSPSVSPRTSPSAAGPASPATSGTSNPPATSPSASPGTSPSSSAGGPAAIIVTDVGIAVVPIVLMGIISTLRIFRPKNDRLLRLSWMAASGLTVIMLGLLIPWPNGFLTSAVWVFKKLAIAVPIVVSVLVTGSNRFQNRRKWILLREGAEDIKTEIFKYRTRVADYSGRLSSPPQIAASSPRESRDAALMGNVVKITERLMDTEANSENLNYDGPIPPRDALADSDDGFTLLTPDRYIAVRLEDQRLWFERQVNKFDPQKTEFQWSILVVGGGGALLAAFGFQLWVALTTAIVTALTAWIAHLKLDVNSIKYNKTAAQLGDVKYWWETLAAERSDPLNREKLVITTEQILSAERSSWVQQMEEVVKEVTESKDGKK